jgi:uncharacterized protein DUF1801
MAESKTRRDPDASVEDFLSAVADQRRRTDAQAMCSLMAEATGAPPVMWGSAIVGFGTYHYRGASGGEGDWPAVGFSPRKQALTLYLADGAARYPELLTRLGPVTTGKGCVYIKRLDDVDLSALRELVTESFVRMNGATVGH